MPYSVYILLNVEGETYVGQTGDVDRRQLLRGCQFAAGIASSNPAREPNFRARARALRNREQG